MTIDKKTLWGIALIFMITVLPSVLSNTVIRIITAVLMASFAGWLVYYLIKLKVSEFRRVCEATEKKRLADFAAIRVPVSKLAQERAQIIPVLVGQLKEVIEQTENAALEIGDKFMSIVERVQIQATKASVAVSNNQHVRFRSLYLNHQLFRLPDFFAFFIADVSHRLCPAVLFCTVENKQYGCLI